MSMYQLADRSGVVRSTVVRIERDEIAQPRAATLTVLAEALGADPAILLKAAGYVPKQTLPSFKPYLRSKYGRTLPPEKLRELGEYFDEIVAEYGKPAGASKSGRTKGGS